MTGGWTKDGTLYAWTSVGDYKLYPQYFNLARRDGEIVLTVRAPEDLSGEWPVMGETASCTLTDEALAELAVVLWSHLDPTLTEIAKKRGLL